MDRRKKGEYVGALGALLVLSLIHILKKELATLRKVMIGDINQIDSLNKLTEQQKLVIADVTKKYNQASQQISNLRCV